MTTEDHKRREAALEIFDRLARADKLIFEIGDMVTKAATAGLPELACRKILRWGDQLHVDLDPITDAAMGALGEDAQP